MNPVRRGSCGPRATRARHGAVGARAWMVEHCTISPIFEFALLPLALRYVIPVSHA